MAVRRLALWDRGRAEWGLRGASAGATALVGGLAVAFSFAQATVKSDPALAYQLAPYDGRIAAARAASWSGLDAHAADRDRADLLALDALRSEPTAVRAASTLGLNAEVRGDTLAARRYFGYSQKLSRRDLQTQLWAIEDATARDDIPGALKHYDIALRTTAKVNALLFQILTPASTDPVIRSALVRILAKRPLWAESFVTYMADNGTNPEATAAFFAALRRVGVPVPSIARASVINVLVATGRGDAAWNYYAAHQDGVERDRSRDPQFAADLETPSLLDWVARNDGGVSTSIQRGRFDFASPPSVSGPLLQQAQLLSPGRYRLSGNSTGIDQLENARPYWELTCSDGRKLGRLIIPNSKQNGGDFTGVFEVPSDCAVQTLSLIAQPSNAASGLSGSINRAELVSLP